MVVKKLVHNTPMPLENRQMNESEIKIEKKDSKESEKSKKPQLQNESLTNLEHEHSKPETVKLKNIEVKMEKVKAEDNKSQNTNTAEIQTNVQTNTETTVIQTNVPKCKLIRVADVSNVQKPSNVAVPRKCPPLSAPLLSERPLVLTTHLVPSLPISLFQVLVEAIEVATERPVVLLYEPRTDRPVAKEITDIAILPASEEWKDSELLPASFCFEHHLNKSNSPCVYADVVVAADCASHINDITDLRGHRCSLPDRKKKIGAAALLFNYLYTKGESPAFFGNTLDADTQVATLQMVAGKQAEIGILESPVIKCHKDILPGIDLLHILTSLGPLPPYRIMVKKTLADVIVKKITAYLLNIDQDRKWVDRFSPFGLTGFTKNFEKFYELCDLKSVVTNVPYY
ncbi:PREDICTED: uncharacterized protein LOC108573095 isoform X2 [Habropoda laboriosa]|nr:PREDICTED: uncharacterized protein LOC108573095 isoform X2 [Habropoda laboriosa]